MRTDLSCAIWIVLVLLSGCVTAPTSTTTPGEPESGDEQGRPPEHTQPGSRAASRMREEGVRQLEAGDTDRASSWLERAIRIDPGAAESYYQLARVRVLEGLNADAKQLLLQANALLDSQGVKSGDLVSGIERLLEYIATRSAR